MSNLDKTFLAYVVVDFMGYIVPFSRKASRDTFTTMHDATPVKSTEPMGKKYRAITKLHARPVSILQSGYTAYKIGWVG